MLACKFYSYCGGEFIVF